MNLKIFFVIFITLFFSQSVMALEKVSLQLKWKNQFQFAGYYMAKEKGFYKNQGLDVKILEYKNGMDIVRSVTSSAVNYGVGYPNIILDKANGANIILLNAIYQNSPHVLISLVSSGIHSIQDFKNKTIMINRDVTQTVSFLSMLRSHNLSFDDVKIKEPTFSIQTLIDNDAQISTAYVSNELYQLDRRGIEYNVWDPKNYGFDFYDDILFTSQKELQEHPQRVEAFRQASLEGYKYAFSHIEETVDVILKKYNTQHRSREALLYEAKVLKKLAYDGAKYLGEIDKVKIQRIIDIYNLFGLVKQKVNLDDFIYVPPHDFQLNKEEKRYLKNKKTITMCIDPHWMPFESLQNGKHVGISAEYFKLIEKYLGTKIEVIPTKTWSETLQNAKNRECDIISLIAPTQERKSYLHLTDTFITSPLVLATRLDAPFTDNFSSLKGKKIGLPKSYATTEYLKKKYPFLEIVEVKNIHDGLTKVSNNELYGYIGTLATVGYQVQKNFIGELKIAAKFDKNWNLSIGVRNDDSVLFSILQKSVHSFKESTKQKILNNWLSVKYEKKENYQLLLKALTLFVVILLIVLYFYIRQKKLTNKIQKQHENMQRTNALLETLFDTIPNPVFYKDSQGVYKNCNSAFSEGLLNISKREVIGKTLYDFDGLMPKNLADFYKQKDDELYDNGTYQYYEAQLKCYDGKYRDFSFHKAVVMSKNRQKLGFLGIMFDITELKNKEKELKQLASIDPLTTLYNRRYFTQASEHILALAKRENFTLSVIMMDIDNFKAVNDTYGHKFGDEVLIAFSNILHNISRESDVACRFGGEEFLILLQKTDLEGALIIAEKIRRNIAEHTFSIEGVSSLSFSVSIGVSAVKVQSEESVENAIKRADDALYEAKESGKNRVCSKI